MVTFVGTQATLGDMLNSLFELNHDCIAAFDSALTRVEREDYRVRLRAMVADLRRHLDALKPHVSALTTNVSDSPSPKEVLTRGRVVVAGLVGDVAILRALHANQQDLVTAYAQSVASPHNNAATHALLVAQEQAARRHAIWLKREVSTPAPPQADDELDATMKQRTIARTERVGGDLNSSTDI